MSLIVGAYPVEYPDPIDQRALYESLGAIPAIRGLELPYRASGGDSWPAAAPDAWSAVVTAIPGTMQRMGADGRFGLASTDTGGRRAALDFTAGVRRHVASLAQEGRRVEAVELHSAPRHLGSPDALKASFEEILGWDWHGAKVVLEHCDALIPGQEPEKGFLGFDDEMDVVAELRGLGAEHVGIVVNWGRSVIEGRDPGTAFEHIVEAKEQGVLAGVMFSGCSPERTEFGYPWIDAHLPALEVEGAPASGLLNEYEIRRCLDAAAGVEIVGFKIGLPLSAATPSERVDRLRQMAELTDSSLGRTA